MIIDFIFGGEDYIKKCPDVHENVLEHTINFTLRFDEELFHFARNNVDYMFVIPCDENYVPLEGTPKKNIDDYKDFLAEKYRVNTEGLSWRGAISKYIRVYKRETTDEEKPLQSAKK